ERLPGLRNYIKGGDSSRWVTGVPRYSDVAYKNAYPGVDIVFHGNGALPEYDFRLQPGADPHAIKLRFEGVTKLAVDAAGNLVGKTAFGSLSQRLPALYDSSGVPVAGARIAYHIGSGDQVCFDISGYDIKKALVIDPVLDFGTYLGGNFGNDVPGSMAVDASGFVYVAGTTSSFNFPVTKHGFQTAIPGGDTDGFVAKLDPTLSRLVYATYLGGSGHEDCNALAIDSAGNAYIAGETNSADFPVSAGAFQRALAGTSNGFVTKLNSTGSNLVF